MVLLNNHLGSVEISKRFFVALIKNTATDCFGVVAMNSGGVKQNAVEMLSFLPFLKNFKAKKFPDKGVAVSAVDGIIHIDLHITVSYGVNVSSVVKSIQHKVAYVVEEQTDMKVGRVNVFVDAINS